MELFDKPIRIMGIPWPVTVVDRIDGSTGIAADCIVELTEIHIAEDIHPGRRGHHLFWCIMHAIQQHIGFGDAHDKGDELDHAHHALFTALRDNWTVVRKWFGYGGGPPQALVRSTALTPAQRQSLQEAVSCGAWIELSSPDDMKIIRAQAEPQVEPATLRIGGMDFKVERPKWVPGMSADTVGLCRSTDLTIYVRSHNISPHRSAEVALHETMHAAIQNACRFGDLEQWVMGMSGPLAQVFFDNPEWMEAIFGDESATTEGG